MTTTQMASESSLSERFAQASADYRRLAASLNALGAELSALGDALDSSRLLPVQVPAAPLLHAHLLGSFQLTVGSHKLSADMQGQAQTVLKYLISHRKRPVTREALLDLLWPDVAPSVGNGRLRVVMHSLRKSLNLNGESLDGKELVMAQGSNVTLNPALEIRVDVEEFEQHWHNGWRLKRDNRLEEAMREYEKAEALYAGDYLDDEPYADWTLLKREALRDAYSTILTMLAGMSFDTGDYTGATIWSQKLLAQDDCREDAYRHLIRSHTRLGQNARAHYWYNLCVRTLRRELGIEPSAETQAALAEQDWHSREPGYTLG